MNQTYNLKLNGKSTLETLLACDTIVTTDALIKKSYKKKHSTGNYDTFRVELSLDNGDSYVMYSNRNKYLDLAAHLEGIKDIVNHSTSVRLTHYSKVGNNKFEDNITIYFG